MRPSSKFSWVAVAVAGLLTALLFFVVEKVPQPTTSLLLADLLQVAIVLWAALCSLLVARRSSGYLRQLWTLLTAALFVSCTAQAVETYYQFFAYTPSLTPWPSDILFILWVTPAVMMLLPRPEKESGAIDWQQVLDFAQIGVVALTAYLYFFYVPSRWETEGPHMVLKIMRLQMIRDAALAAGFLIRAVTVPKGAIRTFLGRVAGLFFVAGVSELISLLTPYTPQRIARWTDVTWCMPYLFAVFFAATWNREEEVIPRGVSSRFRTMVISQALPILTPLLVLFMGRSIAAEQSTIAWIAVTASFILSAARLALTNEKQRRISEDLRASEERFRTLVRDFHVGVVVLGPDAKIQFANQAAEQMFGIKLEEAQGKDSSQLNLIAIREDGTEIPFSMRPGPLALQTGQTFKNEVTGWRRPGSSEVLWTMGNVVPQFAQDGSISALINTFINITERKQAEEALHQLSTRLLQLQDEERRRLGRELHDSLAQSVLAVNLNLAQATRFLTSKDESSRRALAEARRVLVEMSREIRTLSYLLHPPLLDELGLVSTLKEYAGGFSERSGIKLELDIQADFGRLPQQAETALFRIVQESLANIQRHSGTETAMIRLRGDSTCVNLEVIDQGRGMDMKAIERGNGSGARLGVGILGMRERMTQLGGRLEIESSSSGTTVRVSIPLRTEVTDASSHPRSR